MPTPNDSGPSTTPGTTPESIGRLARKLYLEGPALTRFIQHHRHRICPIHAVANQVPPGSRVLDIGCGGGLLVAVLAASGRITNARAIDASKPAIDLAHAMTPRLKDLAPGVAISFEHRTVQEGLPDDRYDAVLLIDVLYHVPPEAQETAFRHAAARVRPGGLFIYKDMADRPLWAASMNKLHDLVMARQWINYVPVESAEAWAASEGLTPHHRKDTRMLWYAHELRVFQRPTSP